MVIVNTTKIYSNQQTIIPKEIREALNTKENKYIEWNLDKNNVVTLTFKNKKETHSLIDMAGIISTKEKTNAVELDRELHE